MTTLKNGPKLQAGVPLSLHSIASRNLANPRIHHPQLFPFPTSFPKIFPRHSHVKSLSAFSSLRSNPTTIASHLKSVSQDAKNLAPRDEREDLVNSISEISNYFEEEDELEEFD